MSYASYNTVDQYSSPSVGSSDLSIDMAEGNEANVDLIGLECDAGKDVTKEVEEVEGDCEPYKKKQRKKSSIIWQEMTLVKLENGVFICEGDSTKFNALDWWKSNNLKFRVLSKMACEILSIPITTVASESTFSAGGRVIDTYRASLGTNTVQMLLCGSDWLRNLYNLKRKVKCTEDVKTISLE